MAISVLAALGLATSLAGTAASGISSLLSNRRQQQNLQDDKAKSDAYYMRQLSQDPTKRSENAAVLRQLDKKQKALNKTYEAKATIMGATPEMGIATKQTTADSYADALSSLASMASQRNDLLSKEQYQDNQRFQQQRDNLELARKQTYANLASNAAKLGGSALQALSTSPYKSSKSEWIANNHGAYALKNEANELSGEAGKLINGDQAGDMSGDLSDLLKNVPKAGTV